MNEAFLENINQVRSQKNNWKKNNMNASNQINWHVKKDTAVIKRKCIKCHCKFGQNNTQFEVLSGVQLLTVYTFLLIGVLLCMFWQFGARLARVQSSAQWGQQQQQQRGPSLLPQSVFKRVSCHTVPVIRPVTITNLGKLTRWWNLGGHYVPLKCLILFNPSFFRKF